MRNLIFIATLALAGCQADTASVAPVAAPVAVDAAASAPAFSSFTQMVNAQRAANGLGPLAPDARLTRAATAHAQDMVTRDYFSHVGANGSSFSDRARAAGYGCPRAENIAFGQRSEQEVLTEWMASAGHRENILLSDATQYGLGRVGNMWVMMIGRRC